MTLALPVLDAMGAEVADQIPRRFCAHVHRQRHVAAAAGTRPRRVELVSDRRAQRRLRLRQVDRAARVRSGKSSVSWAACITPMVPSPIRTSVPTCGSPAPRCTTPSLAPTTRSASIKSWRCTPSSTAGNLRWCSRSTPARASSRGRARSLTAWMGGRFRRRTTRAACSTACSAATALRPQSERAAAAAAHQAGRRRGRKCPIAPAGTRQVRPGADGPVPDLAR